MNQVGVEMSSKTPLVKCCVVCCELKANSEVRRTVHNNASEASIEYQNAFTVKAPVTFQEKQEQEKK